MRHSLRRTIALTAVLSALLMAGCGSGGGSAIAPSPFITRATEKGFSQDALILASRSATSERIPTDLATSIEQNLKTIRQKYPNLVDLHTRSDSDLRSVVVGIAPGTTYRVAWQAGTLTTGDTALDALLQEFKADRVTALTSGNNTGSATVFFTLHFQDPLNTQALAERLRVASGTILEAFSNLTYGDGNRILRETNGDALVYTFSKGSGDCPAGCTNWHNFKVTLTPNGDTSVEESDTPPAQSL